MISVKLHTFLKSYCPRSDGCLQLQYEEGLTVKKILEQLNLNTGIVGLVLVNGRIVQSDYKLAEGDSMEIYPLFGGG